MGLSTKLLFLAVLPIFIKAQFIQTPQSQVAILGETVTLRCTFNVSPGAVLMTYWLKGSSHITVRRQILEVTGEDVKRRYSIVGDTKSMEYSLNIVDVKVEDAGEYSCVYISASSVSTTVPAIITVIVPPKADFPVCLSTPEPGAHKPGSTVQLNCISLGGVPRADLTWTRNAIQLGNMTFDNNKITHVLTPEDNGVYFKCSATSPALRKPRMCVIMPMKIPPSPMIKESSNSSLVGDDFTASCRSDGIPAIGSYSWFIDGRPVDFTNPRFSEINHHIKIRNLQKKEDNSILTCMATTTLGLTGNYSILLTVNQPTTTAPPTTLFSTTTQATDTVTNSNIIINPWEEVESEVKNKDYTDTSVTRYNMKLILALIFGMLIFIFIIVLMTLTYFFASHTTRAQQKESRYEETTLGPNYNNEDPIGDRVSKTRDFPHYPQTYVSQDPLTVGLAGLAINDHSYDQTTSSEFEMTVSQEKLTDEEKIESLQAAVDPISDAKLESDEPVCVVIENDATAKQQNTLIEREDVSCEMLSEPIQAPTPKTSDVNTHSTADSDLDERNPQAMTPNSDCVKLVITDEHQPCADPKEDISREQNVVNVSVETPSNSAPLEVDVDTGSDTNAIRASQLSDEVD